MPQTILKVFRAFNIDEKQINISSLKNNDFFKEKDKINKLDILFKKIEND